MKDFGNLKIGILALQGAVAEHVQSVQKCGASAVAVRRDPAIIKELDGLILPGGESTTIGRLGSLYGFREEIRNLAAGGKPLFGTCAGLVLLAEEVEGQDPLLPLLSVSVKRNAYGRQRESFEADLVIEALGSEPFCGVFIRAPRITSVSREVEILAEFENTIVGVRQGNIIATAFHPELTDDLRIHRYFLQQALESRASRAPSTAS